MNVADQRLARAVRNAAVFGLDDVAVSVGVTCETVVETLLRLPARGRCDEMWTETMKRPISVRSPDVKTLLRRLPPGLVRVSADNHLPFSGSAGWAQRRADDPGASRAAIAAAVCGDAALRRDKAAAHPRCPPMMLERLAGNSSWWVRSSVAGNTSSGPGIIQRLVDDIWFEATIAAARNPLCPPWTLQRLAAHGFEKVREAAAANPAMPPDTLRRLAGDDAAVVRSAAQEALGMPPPRPGCGHSAGSYIQRARRRLPKTNPTGNDQSNR